MRLQITAVRVEREAELQATVVKLEAAVAAGSSSTQVGCSEVLNSTPFKYTQLCGWDRLFTVEPRYFPCDDELLGPKFEYIFIHILARVNFLVKFAS